jgi:hypothetical protein
VIAQIEIGASFTATPAACGVLATTARRTDRTTSGQSRAR